jgi:hypothetical protein
MGALLCAPLSAAQVGKTTHFPLLSEGRDVFVQNANPKINKNQ